MACLWILSVFARGCEVLSSGSCVSIVEQEREPYSMVSLSQLLTPITDQALNIQLYVAGLTE